MAKIDIQLIDNGPIKVSNNSDEPLKEIISFDKENLTLESSLFICRCGRTKKQPFCDGTHKKANFSSQKEIEEDNIQFYPGKEIDIYFNRSICSGAANCVRNHPDIYISASEDWIFPDKSSKEEVIKSIKNCPSGALSYKEKDVCQTEEYSEEKIEIVKLGPIYVKGKIQHNIVSWSTNANEEKFALCRCGESKNKPFCDYTHASLKGDEFTF